MASASTSSVQKSFKHDVFISFRGEDTRKGFVSHLYDALQRQSIITYKDDEKIKKGNRISDELIKSIEDSKFYIIVFSKDYASSSWCLDELVKIMECQKTSDQKAYPVFYDVEPTEVRNQSGLVGEAFSKHEKDEAAGKWRGALKEAAGLAGWELKNTLDGHEAKFIQTIVHEISLELRVIDLGVDEKLVGIQNRVKGVVSTLETGSDDVRMIGIKGIGGGGKTTLARAIFDHISSWFEGKSFVENVREVSTASLSGLKILQKQIQSDVLNDQGINISSVHDGKQMMKKMMCGRKVLVVLDDVDHVEQLEALAGEPNWFKAGSRIIITTRDEQVLVAHRVTLIHNVKLLSTEEAICLFSRYTFGKAVPMEGYEELSENVVRYAAGLPLTIRVMGSFLCGKTRLEWEDALERLKTIPLKDTLEKLELSYIGLEEDYKEIFLDVACILKGWEKEKAIEVLESCGFHARNGLRVLEQRSLITINGHASYLGMHDHIEELGKNIVRRLHPDEPRMHSRLWIREEIEDISTNDSGNYNAIQCIKGNWISNETYMRSLGNMKKLRFLEIDRTKGLEIQCLPNALRYLKWSYYPFQSLIKSFQADNLVGLSMTFSKIMKFWEPVEIKVLHKLRFLDMSHSDLRIFELELAPNIEMLNLSSCRHLVELKMPLGCSKLKALYLSYSGLRTLNLASTPNLETLNLHGCKNLVEVTMIYQCPKLKVLNLQYSRLLTTLNLAPTPILETLALHGCKELTELTMPYQCSKLKALYLQYSGMRTLNLAPTPDLETLDLQGCKELTELTMPYQCSKLKALYLQYSGLRTLNLAPTLNYETLDLQVCEIIAEVTMPYQYPKLKFLRGTSTKLTTLDIQRISNMCPFTHLESFLSGICDLQGLRKLTLEGSFCEVPKDLERLQSLNELSLLSTIMIKHLPDSICMLKNLKHLELNSCSFIEKLPEGLGRLECMEDLNLTSCINLQEIPKSICDMKRLKCLNLSSCLQVKKLPRELRRLECLKVLNIKDTGIIDLPDGIFELEGLHIVASNGFSCTVESPQYKKQRT